MADLATGHGVGDTSQYYDKWDKLAKEEAKKAKAEEEARKAASDAALGLDKEADAPKSATEKADREKRAQIKDESKKYEGVENDREKQKVCIEGLRRPLRPHARPSSSGQVGWCRALTALMSCTLTSPTSASSSCTIGTSPASRLSTLSPPPPSRRITAPWEDVAFAGGSAPARVPARAMEEALR